MAAADRKRVSHTGHCRSGTSHSNVRQTLHMYAKSTGFLQQKHAALKSTDIYLKNTFLTSDYDSKKLEDINNILE